MKQFILFFRMDITTKEAQPSEATMAVYMKQWNKWISTITAQNKLIGGNHLITDGKVLRAKNLITQGPYTVNCESIAGYIIVKAKDFDEAVTIAKSCPILLGDGTSVEVREIATM